MSNSDAPKPWSTEREAFLRLMVAKPERLGVESIRELAAEVLHLREQLGRNRCNSGHETLPLTLWDCPACTEEERAHLRALRTEDKEQAESDLRAAKAHAADLQGEIATLQEALPISKLRSDGLERERNENDVEWQDLCREKVAEIAKLHAENDAAAKAIEEDQIELVKLRAAIQAAGFAVMETSGTWSIHDTREPKRPKEAIETAMRRLRDGLGIATFDVLEPEFRIVLEHLVDDVAKRHEALLDSERTRLIRHNSEEQERRREAERQVAILRDRADRAEEALRISKIRNDELHVEAREIAEQRGKAEDGIERVRGHWEHIAMGPKRIDPGSPTCLRCVLEGLLAGEEPAR